MREINGLIKDLLHAHGKGEFSSIIELTLPATERNHKKFRKAIIETLQHLREMNIRSAINSSDDALGKFYETFLKYANGAKEMGIVLTPRHITRFAADVVGIGPKDVVFDPACGTGGFLISALESIKASEYADHKKFAAEGLYGVEQRDDVYGLAIVNMIFRGDGKSHIYDGDCFDYQFWKRDRHISYSIGEEVPEGSNKPFTRVLMNPPFKLSTNSEPQFVDHGLRQMALGGILFAVLPYIVIEPNKYKTWRKQLLKRHTLRAVIKLDKNLFYPVQEATYALILQAHEPHCVENEVFMGCLFDDSHRPRKSKMLSDHEINDNLEKLTKDVRRFLLGQSVDCVTREQVLVHIDPEGDCNFAPEAYLTTGECPITPIDVGFRAIESKTAKLRVEARNGQKAPLKLNTKVFPLSDFIESHEVSKLKALKDYPQGDIPVVTAQWKENGIARWLDVPDDYCFENCITISVIHNTKPCQAFWHPYRFAALNSSVMILRPKQEIIDIPNAILYLCEATTKYNSWRYHYARTVNFQELMVEVPSKNGKPDIKKMADIVNSQT